MSTRPSKRRPKISSTCPIDCCRSCSSSVIFINMFFSATSLSSKKKKTNEDQYEKRHDHKKERDNPNKNGGNVVQVYGVTPKKKKCQLVIVLTSSQRNDVVLPSREMLERKTAQTGRQWACRKIQIHRGSITWEQCRTNNETCITCPCHPRSRNAIACTARATSPGAALRGADYVAPCRQSAGCGVTKPVCRENIKRGRSDEAMPIQYV